MAKRRPTSIESITTDWTDIVMVCRKCGDSGFGPKGEDGLRAALKRMLREWGLRRRIGVVEVGCFGICPKKAVTTALGSRPQQLVVVPEGESAEAVLSRLGVRISDETTDRSLGDER